MSLSNGSSNSKFNLRSWIVSEYKQYDKIGLMYILSGNINIGGVLTCTVFFSNSTLHDYYPEVMSRFGCVMVMVWGLLFLAHAKHWKKNPIYNAVFAIEKWCYVASWIYFLDKHGSNSDIADLFNAQDEAALAAFFFIGYGINDIFFAFLYMYAYYIARKDALVSDSAKVDKAKTDNLIPDTV